MGAPRSPTPKISPSDRPSPLGIVGATWGILGVIGLLGQAIVRLGAASLGALRMPWAWYHSAFIIVWIPLMVFSEGYHGFQRGFSPRVAARAADLCARPTALRVALAPLFCIGYFGIERRNQLLILGITAVMLGLVVLIHTVPQPWRGAIDLGVIAGLLWGVIALVVYVTRGLKK